MELEELKHSWSLLNKQLQQPLTDEKQLKELIAQYRENAQKNLNSLSNIQRISIALGMVIGSILAGLLCTLSFIMENGLLYYKTMAFILFFLASLLLGRWWDYKMYHWCQQIKIDTMTVVEISQRMVQLRRWTRYEIYIVCMWITLLNALNYWCMDFYLKPINQQTLILLSFVTGNIIIVGLFYRMIYKQLNSIKKNI